MKPASEKIALSRGQNLFFLISQPRAGSTLLQSIIGSHPDVHTTPEPWLMLYPSYSFRREGTKAEYEFHWAWTGLHQFLSHIPDGKEIYAEGVRRLYLDLYNASIESAGKTYFLDKTPRYYLISDELNYLFPEARYIFLIRNPIAVLCSIARTWIHGYWYKLNVYKKDLIDAPEMILNSARFLSEKSTLLRYEEVLKDPAVEMKRLYEDLDISPRSSFSYSSPQNIYSSELGDKTNVDKKRMPDCSHLDRWKEDVKDPQIWRLVNDYVDYLGEDLLGRLGYSYSDMKRELIARYPGKLALTMTFSLEWYLREDNEYRGKDYIVYRTSNAIQGRGCQGFLKRILKH